MRPGYIVLVSGFRQLSSGTICLSSLHFPLSPTLSHTLRIRSVCSCQSIIRLLIYQAKFTFALHFTFLCILHLLLSLYVFHCKFLFLLCIFAIVFAAFALHLSGWKLPVKRKVVVKIVKSLFLSLAALLHQLIASAFRCLSPHTHIHTYIRIYTYSGGTWLVCVFP